MITNELERHDRVARLLAGHLQGSLTGDEAAELERWKEASGRHRALYREITGEDFLRDKLEEAARVDHVAAWLAINARHARRARARRVRRATAAAAVVALVAGAVYLLAPGRGPLPSPVAAIVPGELKAELVLPGGEVIRLDKDSRVGELLASSSPSPVATPGRPGDHVLRTPRGGEYTVTLPDGTTVYLNAESELRFPVAFEATGRSVSLAGEAYFEVARDDAAPFRVELATSVVEVLGTCFNVRAYADEEETRATLVAGSVRFAAGDREVILRPGEQGALDRLGRLDKREVDVELYAGWKDGYFAFDQTPLEEVMASIARWYKIDVVFDDPALREISFSGIVKRYENFSTIVEMLEMTGDTRFVIDNNKVKIQR
ncbi:MAG: FecR domain-containing protein [Odoribacteraceae bacterium]|nr:FecR domain-containing protein [Odoribacteraceae bacterium]